LLARQESQEPLRGAAWQIGQAVMLFRGEARELSAQLSPGLERQLYVDSSLPLGADIVEKLEFLRRSQFRGPLEASTENS
jgi:hypothetical protein